MRLQSDFAISQDPRTACFWQAFVSKSWITWGYGLLSDTKIYPIDEEAVMTTAFKIVMAKMQVLGQNLSKLVDCSEVIPTSKTFTGPIKYPASFSQADVQIAVSGFIRSSNYYVLNFIPSR